MVKTFILTFLFISWHAFAAGKNSYYPGMVHLLTGVYYSSGPSADLSKQVSNRIVFDFFKEPTDSEAIHSLSFYFDWAHIPRQERIWENDYAKWLSPMSFDTMGDYEIYFTCKSKKRDWLEVVVNEKTQQTLWIRNTFYTQFLSWNRLTSRKRWITVSATNRIYTRPDTTSDTLHTAVNCFHIDKVKGDWMRISTGDNELCDCYGQPRIKKAWIRFRRPDALLINVSVY